MAIRLLLVEDQAMVGNTIVDVLQSHGFDVDWVQNAEDALQRFEERPHQLVLTDIELPRTSGLELLRRLRAIQPEARVIVMSGSGPVEPGSLLLDAREDGAAATLTKPFRFSELVQVLHRVLDDVPVPRNLPEERKSFEERKPEHQRNDFSGEGLS